MTKARDNYGKALAFIEHALQQETDDCILWPFGLIGGRYPNIGHGKRVNRIVCERKHGAPPFEKAEAAHHCAMKLCVNHRHLYWATRAQNVADSIRHGTQVNGERARSKLKATDVRMIRASTESCKQIANQFGISTTQVYFIRKRQSWKELE
jgi:hypothetical protein